MPKNFTLINEDANGNDFRRMVLEIYKFLRYKNLSFENFTWINIFSPIFDFRTDGINIKHRKIG
jgi:hypothetical protein